jgi:hypothetical protein
MTSKIHIQTGAAQPTPMMKQYLAIKREAEADTLLFYRMGDFYELFFEDAEAVAEALDIALIKRGRHDGKPIPMTGIPVHASETYLARLVKSGFKVAVCETTECPSKAKQRGSKAVMRREIIRIVTPCTSAVAAPPMPTEPPATETTPEGEQTLLQGVAPVTLRQRLDAVGARPLTAGPTARQFWGAASKPQRHCDHGLFDQVGRAQTDLCDLIATLPPIQTPPTPSHSEESKS